MGAVMADPNDESEPAALPDIFGRQVELVHAVTCRLHHGPPMSKWDWYAVLGLQHVLGLEFVEPDDETSDDGAPAT